MTDFEINRAVGDASGVEWAGLDSNYHPLSIWNDGELCVFCPCNSWADAGPIIQKSSISIIKYDDSQWRARCRADMSGIIDANPMRAAMIVFLKMQESK